MLEPARDYFRLAKRVPFEEFALDLDVNVFLLAPYGEAAESQGFETTAKLGAGEGGTHKVARIQKSSQAGANAFGYMITIGRTQNNDITVPSPQVSKFHCFVVEEDGNWLICDAGSSNGTFIGGTRLEPQTRTPLACGTPVTLSEHIELTFYTPQGLYEHLRSLGFLL